MVQDIRYELVVLRNKRQGRFDVMYLKLTEEQSRAMEQNRDYKKLVLKGFRQIACQNLNLPFRGTTARRVADDANPIPFAEYFMGRKTLLRRVGRPFRIESHVIELSRIAKRLGARA